MSANLSDANLAGNKSAINAVSEGFIGNSQQNGGINISGRLSSIQPKPDAAYSETHQSQLMNKSHNKPDPTIEDVDDGIKSQRVSFREEEEDEDQEEEDYEAQEVEQK